LFRLKGEERRFLLFFKKLYIHCSNILVGSPVQYSMS
jgi:hypothetical protein